MKVVLATGIYPPEIGGPATYVRALAEELTKKGVEVIVVTYGRTSHLRQGSGGQADFGLRTSENDWDVVRVSKWGGPFLRWWRYAKALEKHAADADIVCAFSSVSCGMPLRWAKLQKPKKILRLGGDFFWERYTDRGGMKSLRDWYVSGPRSLNWMQKMLQSFHHIVFSTRMQEEICEKHYKDLPAHSVVENAVPEGQPVLHEKHEPFRLLFMGRFVGFKNLLSLVQAVRLMSDVTITFVGSGPMRNILKGLSASIGERVTFREPVHGEEKQKIFTEHDLMVIPSVTELSPNVALEARAAGLPVLLTNKTGLSPELSAGMTLAPIFVHQEIRSEVLKVQDEYEAIAEAAAIPPLKRSWEDVVEEYLSLFRNLQ